MVHGFGLLPLLLLLLRILLLPELTGVLGRASGRSDSGVWGADVWGAGVYDADTGDGGAGVYDADTGDGGTLDWLKGST